MRYLVVSDLHSNWEALEAVLHDAAGQYDRIVCCGDLAGYGPDPNRVIDWARERLFAVIRGNHDRACAGLENLEWFNPVAQAASMWTMSQLTPVNFGYLRDLPPGPLTIDPQNEPNLPGGHVLQNEPNRPGRPVLQNEPNVPFQLIHGSPLDEDEYLVSVTDARNVFSYLEVNIAFFGHTHLQGGYAWRNGHYMVMPRLQASQTQISERLDPDGAYLINPGSVGQPRDGDPRAAFALFDSTTREIIQRRIEYDYEATRRKIVAAGLPDVLGSRLTIGR